MLSGVKEDKDKKISSFCDSFCERNQWQKVVFDRTSLFLFLPLSNLPIICLHYALLFYSTHPELPSLSVSSYQFSFSYSSIYCNILSLVLGTIVHGCRLKLRQIVVLAIQMCCILPLSSLALRMFANAELCILPSATLSTALSLPRIYHPYVL